ncbi:hypothetical protein CPB83DRAFT_900633 [Crepidotus variabilis]|uniref:Uncharacterized protein n=1 Tax=Crepidotus variabilis TaxID=179855 RepID=A0A9P6JHL4_9AGAR|nr:hypothetical protein CPB83DRAFT_900633 [Crepidotus variabilis]
MAVNLSSQAVVAGPGEFLSSRERMERKNHLCTDPRCENRACARAFGEVFVWRMEGNPLIWRTRADQNHAPFTYSLAKDEHLSHLILLETRYYRVYDHARRVFVIAKPGEPLPVTRGIPLIYVVSGIEPQLCDGLQKSIDLIHEELDLIQDRKELKELEEVVPSSDVGEQELTWPSSE